ncbi:hypothetical protein OK17_15360 [Gordonia sp. GN26]
MLWRLVFRRRWWVLLVGQGSVRSQEPSLVAFSLIALPRESIRSQEPVSEPLLVVSVVLQRVLRSGSLSEAPRVVSWRTRWVPAIRVQIRKNLGRTMVRAMRRPRPRAQISSSFSCLLRRLASQVSQPLTTWSTVAVT